MPPQYIPRTTHRNTKPVMAALEVSDIARWRSLLQDTFQNNNGDKAIHAATQFIWFSGLQGNLLLQDPEMRAYLIAQFGESNIGRILNVVKNEKPGVEAAVKQSADAHREGRD